MGQTRTRSCIYCGEPVKRPDRNEYCSQECYRAAKGRRIGIPSAVCECCGKEYKPTGSTKGRFCSFDCFRKSARAIQSESYARGDRKQHASTKSTDEELLGGWERLKAGEFVSISDLMQELGYSERSGAYKRLKQLVGIEEYEAVNDAWFDRKYPESLVQSWFDAYRASKKNLKEFASTHEVCSDLLGKLFRMYFPVEYEDHIEQSSGKMYKRGRAFEYRCRDYMKKLGYYVYRSPQSRGPADLLALKKGQILLVQCKLSRNGFSKKEKLAITELAEQVGGTPLLAYRAKKNGPIVWINLTSGDEWPWAGS
jgi:Holliday junction resolvase